MLTMFHSNPARIVNGNLLVDRKFHLGMLQNVRHIKTPIVSVHPQGQENEPIFDGVDLPYDQLGYGILTVQLDSRGRVLPSELSRMEGQIAVSRLVYGDSMGSPALCRKAKVPYVMILEYDLKTQVTVTASQVKSPLRKAVRAVRCAATYAATQVNDMRHAHSLHCNGYPIYDESRFFNQNRLLYLDSRMSADLLIDAAALRERCSARIGRPLRLLYSGRYEALKGATHAVRVALECMKLGLEFEMHCYGQGSQKGEMQVLAAQSRGNAKIVIHDVIPYPELAAQARTFDVFVCCHIQADPSCSYLESFGAGLPIVGFANRMWKRLSQESGVGFVAPMERPDLVARDVQKLAVDQQVLASMSEKALEFASAHLFERESLRRIDALNTAMNSLS